MITQSELKSVLIYFPESGCFEWVSRRFGVKKNLIAGMKSNRNDYQHVTIFGKRYSAHRLAWLYMYGSYPRGSIDHINGIKGDNRISNLRLSTVSQNGMNRTANKNSITGEKGIYIRDNGKYLCQVMANGRRVTKSFDYISDARLWINNKRIEMHGEFSNNS